MNPDILEVLLQIYGDFSQRPETSNSSFASIIAYALKYRAFYGFLKKLDTGEAKRREYSIYPVLHSLYLGDMIF